MVDINGEVTTQGFLNSIDQPTNRFNRVDLSSQSNDPRYLVSAQLNVDGRQFQDVTVKEVVIGESLLNPSAHAVVTLQSAMYFRPQDWDYFRCLPVSISIADNNNIPNNPRTMLVNQEVYRCDNRRFAQTNTGSVEELSLHTIDRSILRDAETIWEKSYSCATPAQVVSDALRQIGVTRFNILGSTGPGRPYVAESIHPLQAIQQQANVALYEGTDPSFIHYMTIREQTGENVHNFRSLAELMSNKHTAYDIYAADTAVSGGNSFSDIV